MSQYANNRNKDNIRKKEKGQINAGMNHVINESDNRGYHSGSGSGGGLLDEDGQAVTPAQGAGRSRRRAWTRRSVCQTAERARCTLNTNILPPNKRGRDLTDCDCVTCPMYVCTADREKSERAVFQF